MDRNSRVQEDLRDEAATWFAELSEEADSESRRAAFAQWLLRSPDHIKVYLHVTSVAATVAATAQDSVEDLIRAARAESEPKNVIELLREPRAAQPEGLSAPLDRGGGWKWLAASVAAVTVPFVWFFIGLGPQPLHIRTKAGEQRTLTIADGSVLYVRSDSELIVELQDSRRDIRLERGEARFDVAKDPRRPFIVVTPHATVRAVGTIFDVVAASSRTAVTVFEGRVEVASVEGALPAAIDAPNSAANPAQHRAQLAAGESATVSPAGEIIHGDRLAGNEARPPVRRGLEFREESLANVLERFSLQGSQRIRIDDPQLAQLMISGAFSADDSESLLEYLRRYHGVAVIEMDDGVRALVRAPTRVEVREP